MIGSIATATDIEEHKRGEEARIRLLAKEKEAREEAQAASRMKDEFLATVSHELRTPLTAILGWTRIIRTGKLDPSKFARGLDVIERNGRAQAAIIDDILDVSRIITGKLRIELDAIDLAAVVQAAIDTVKPAADAKEILSSGRMISPVIAIPVIPTGFNKSSGICCPTRSSSPPRGATSRLPLRKSTRMSSCELPTTGKAFRPALSPTFSIVSDRLTERAPVGTAGSVWGSPSFDTWSSYTAERCMPTAQVRTRGRRSSCGCRCAPSKSRAIKTALPDCRPARHRDPRAHGAHRSRRRRRTGCS